MGRAMAKSELSGRVSAPVMWLLARHMTADDPTDMIRTIEAEDAFYATGHLHRITAPALVVGGEKDHLNSPELFRSTARGIPGGRLLHLPGTSHMGAVTDRTAARETLAFLTG